MCVCVLYVYFSGAGLSTKNCDIYDGLNIRNICFCVSKTWNDMFRWNDTWAFWRTLTTLPNRSGDSDDDYGYNALGSEKRGGGEQQHEQSVGAPSVRIPGWIWYRTGGGFEGFSGRWKVFARLRYLARRGYVRFYYAIATVVFPNQKENVVAGV